MHLPSPRTSCGLVPSWMASITHHYSVPPDDTHSSWKARIPFRNRRRFLFLATAFAAISLLYSSHQLLGEKFPRLTVTITQTAPSTAGNVFVEPPPVQPVVFSLIMISEQSAQEGVILLKVHHSTFILFPYCGLVVTNSLFSPLSCTRHDPSISILSATKLRRLSWRLDSAFSHARYIASLCDFTGCHSRAC